MRRSGRSFAHSPKRCEQGSRDTKRAPGTPCHVPTASQPTPTVSAAHGLQQFPVLPKAWADKLAEKYVYSPMGTTADGQAIVRFCTSWATRDEDVDALLADIAAL